MSFQHAPKKAGLPREVLKWLQSLDLTYSVKNVRRDFSNGFLVAEIFSWYYPQSIQMHSYDNGTSLPTKLGNWSQLERVFVKHSLDIPKELIDGTIHCKPGAAELLVQQTYTILTNRIVKNLPSEQEQIDFTDRSYQLTLPMHARSTVSQALKNNLKITEFMTDPNVITCQEKAQQLIHKHQQHRVQERVEDPVRFDIQPSIGELAVRIAPTDSIQPEYAVPKPPKAKVPQPPPKSQDPMPSRTVAFKEITVSQMGKPTLVRPGLREDPKTALLQH
ncbi:spermatogenesis-associated protein 4-like [Branchiostoma floridae]|uniref:Spermatogenesis-associated protein 4 n=1 Tax=Branchiostoma floridae TaxID=7739 RepID=A0A9J7LDK7_BRAFL|nr:spermatogenesis-associated protein 4-like [Branchiostoma floridae]